MVTGKDNSLVESSERVRNIKVRSKSKSKTEVQATQDKSEDKTKSRENGNTPPVSKKLIPKIKKNHVDTLIPVEETLRDRWFIKGLIGNGGYGEIYLAIDMKQAEEVAIKVEPKKRRGKLAKRMILEQKLLLRLQGRPHVPKLIASGNETKLNWIVMQLLSVNVGDLKKASPVKRLSPSTVGRILQQGIGALRDVHTACYLHRDVKPANMCFGITPTTRHILMLVDFGLVRKYKNGDGTLRPLRKKAGFRGTLRYVSLRVHNRIDQSPADDLVSMLYSGIELLTGELPWKYLNKPEQVKAAKEELQSTDPSGYISLMFEPFQEFSRAVLSLNVEEEPNYTALQALLQEMIGDKKLSEAYDWDNNYKDVLDTSTKSDKSDDRRDLKDRH